MWWSLTAKTNKAFGLRLRSIWSNSTADNEIENSQYYNGEKEILSFRFPFHADRANDNHDGQGNSTNDPNVVLSIVDNFIAIALCNEKSIWCILSGFSDKNNQRLLNKSLTEEQKPIVFIDAATALAKANTIPTEAPNSGPSDREMI